MRQTQKWLRLHEQCSPARTDTGVRRVYGRAFTETIAFLEGPDGLPADEVEVVGLGCGSGAKDCALVEQLVRAGRKVFYTAVDVSLAMVLTARETALKILPEENCRAVVCDLATEPGLAEAIFSGQGARGARRVRIVTAFGLLPTFEPGVLLPVLSRLGSSAEALLVSANLAPGAEYAAGIGKVLPGYENELTRDWLMSALKDLDIWPDDGDLRFGIEEGGMGCRRIVGWFRFGRQRTFRLWDEEFFFEKGETLRVFFSYRHTPELVRKIAKTHSMNVEREWISESGEEGVFLLRGLS